MFKKSYLLMRYCYFCGKKFKVIKYMNRYQLDKFCERKCHDKHTAEMQRKGHEIRMNDRWKNAV